MSDDSTMKSVTFDQAAEYYDATRGLPEGIALEAASLLVKAGNLTSESNVLEIAVGTGRIAEPLINQVRRLAGVDLSRLMLQQFVAKVQPLPANLLLTQGDITQLPYPANSFDAIVAVHVFHLVPAYEQALVEAARVLKPDGRLVHGTSGLGFGDIWNSWRDVLKDYPPQLARLNWDKIDPILRELGWTGSTEPQVLEYTYRRTPDTIRQWLQARRFSITWDLPEELLQRGVEVLTQALDETYEDPTQPIDMPAEFRVFTYTPPQA